MLATLLRNALGLSSTDDLDTTSFALAALICSRRTQGWRCGSLDPVWAIYGVLDLTREGRGDSAAYPNLQY